MSVLSSLFLVCLFVLFLFASLFSLLFIVHSVDNNHVRIINTSSMLVMLSDWLSWLQEMEAVTAFLQRDQSGQSSKRVSYKDFDR